MSLTGTVVPDDGLRVRSGPGTEHSVIGILSQDETIILIEKVEEWWGVESRFGLGFVHAAFVRVEPSLDSPGPETPALEASYTCVAGDTLLGIGARFGIDFGEIASLNGLVSPFTIRVGQVLRIPGARPQLVATGISILNPLESAGGTLVTSSSLQGHHTPFLGHSSCDLDVIGVSSPGTGVRFNVAGAAGMELRGVVGDVGLACASQLVSDGGRTVKVNIERGQPDGTWSATGTWVLYAHLDPVVVSRGDVLTPGTTVGALGPPGGGEYNSSCAQGSHVHIEAAGGQCIVNQHSTIGADPVIALNV